MRPLHYIFTCLTALALLHSGFTNAQIIDYTIDPGFDSGEYFIHGRCTSILPISDDRFIVTGNFEGTLPGMATGLTIIEEDGNVIYEDYPHSLGPTKVAPFQSKFLSTASRIQKRNEYGNTDYSFRFEFQKDVYNSFISDAVYDFIVYRDSLVMAAGIFFTDSLDLSANSIRQFCVVDSTGVPVEGIPMVQCEPVDARIRGIDTLSTGDIILSGTFTSVNGHPTNNIARLTPDFNVDNTFTSPLLEGGTASISMIDSDDRIWVTLINSFLENSPDIGQTLIRLLPNGSIDQGFEIPEILRHYAGSEISGFASIPYEDTDGTFLLGGAFDEFNGQTCANLIKVNDNGEMVEGFFNGLGPDEAYWENWSGNGSFTNIPLIGCILPLQDGKLLLGGLFSSFGGEPYNGLVRIMPNGFVATKDAEERLNLNIYPNPATDQIQIRGDFQSQVIQSLTIHDIQGRVVIQKQNHPSSKPIDVSSLPSGMFLLRVESESGVGVGSFVVF